MSEPSDDIDTVLEAVAKRTGALGKGSLACHLIVDDIMAIIIGGVPNMNLSAVRFIRAFRTGMLGYFVLDDYKREPLLTALRIMQQDA
jgi:ribosome biogenesis GTPase A